jgi:hypothetical protein
MDPATARKNVRLGLVLFAVALVLFAGSILIAEIYNVASG